MLTNYNQIRYLVSKSTSPTPKMLTSKNVNDCYTETSN